MDDLTPAHIAAKKGCYDIFRTLVEKGANLVNACTSGLTPLHYATVSGDTRIIELLLEKSVGIHSKAIQGLTPLYMAVQKGNTYAAALLIDSNAYSDNLALTAAISGNHFDIVKLLLDKTTGKNDLDDEILTAVESGNSKILELLIEKGADVSAEIYDISPLMLAVAEGKKEIVEYLLERGALIECQGDALVLAVIQGHKDIVKTLIKHGYNVNSKSDGIYNALHSASETGDTEIVNFLIDNGADVNALSSDNETPLMLAAVEGHDDVAEILISKGGIVNSKSADGFTPLHSAAEFGHDNVARVLLRNHADIFSRDSERRTALEIAVQRGHVGVVKSILNHNDSAVNIKTDLSGTLLHVASASGAVYNVKDDNGKTPLNYSVDRCIIDLFEKVNNAFNSIEDGTAKIIDVLSTIGDSSTVKAIMCARNSENETLLVFAVKNRFKNVQQLKEIVHSDTPSQFNEAELLSLQGDYKAAFSTLENLLKKRKEILGQSDYCDFDIRLRMIEVLVMQENYQKSLCMAKELLEKQVTVWSATDEDVLETKRWIALMLHKLERNEESLKNYEEVHRAQEKIFHPHHSAILRTELEMALPLNALGRHEEALDGIKSFEFMHGIEGSYDAEALFHLQQDIHSAANRGDVETVQLLLSSGTRVDVQDVDGKTPLHFAVCGGHINVLNILLKHGADATDTTYKNYTALHFAIAKRYSELVDILLQSVSSSKLVDFLNVQTLNDGKTALHVAAKNGDLEIVRKLLAHGATYNFKTMDGNTPLNLCENKATSKLLKLLDELFDDAKRGNSNIIMKLKKLSSEDFKAVTNAQSNVTLFGAFSCFMEKVVSKI
ncbi:serine/threonine-protein phosphatase 6 regulatory ankyrin repeat subunit B-like [Uloborus diversus]|uniref:serine/threonine-protein phosphatase 6 regulatory ankyrin repeat subunit B-like n=1 Tax=Uloborus diversus TaxID=327109 RepID=UPI00240A1F3A|nr:serine/threonine-protein phosphatase 6 regulatory ankyrin repeat subunit B-like [Uloborus diversus]